MNKQEALTRLSNIEAEAKELRAIIDAPEKTPEQRFIELIECVDINRPIVDFEKYPTSIFWALKDGSIDFEYDFKNGWLWVNYFSIWSVFYNEFSLSHDEVQHLIKELVEKHFKLKGVTPNYYTNPYLKKVEKHFKLKGVTPLVSQGA